MAVITTPVQVANMALGLVGQRQLIGAFNDVSVEAQVASLYYESARDELLTRWHWRFATKRVVLALATDSAGAAIEREGWGFCYAAPADMLVPQSIYSGKREPGKGEEVAFTLEQNDTGTGFLILTDMETPELKYTVRVDSVALWSPLFVKAVAAQLGVYMAPALPIKPELIPTYEMRAERAFQVAAAQDANAATRDEIADSEFIRERG